MRTNLVLHYFMMLIGVCQCFNSRAQQTNTWIQKANFSAGTRNGAVSFSIGSKGYVGTGAVTGFLSPTKDFWEYDPLTDSWTQKADFGGTERYNAVGFSIGTKGYIGTGANFTLSDPNVNFNDFWEYDPSSNTWTQKANFGGSGRYAAAGFSIGSKGYIGTGTRYTDATGYVDYNDFWEYNPSSDAWTQKANFGGSARDLAAGFSIDTKGYMGTGDVSGTGGTVDFWEYNPSSDAWTQKANFGGSGRFYAVGFSITTKGYIGTGYTTGYTNDFWEYNPSADSWTQKATFGGDTRNQAVGFSVGRKGYLGLGYNPTNSYKSDIWEYSSASGLFTDPLGASTYCAGASISVSYSSSEITFNSGNVFTAQLSNSSGSFTSPVSIGTLTSTSTSGTISATIPSNTASGSGYRIRVISSNPSTIGNNNGTNITVNLLPGDPSSISMTFQSSCIGWTDWDASFQPYPLETGATYLWSINGGSYASGLPYYNDTYNLSQSSDASITLNVKYQNGCGTGNALVYPATFYSPCGGFRMSVWPNPVNDILQIEENNISPTKVVAKTSIQIIEIVDKMGLVVYKKNYGTGTRKTTVFVGNIKNDIYTVRIFNGEEWKSQKIIVRH